MADLTTSPAAYLEPQDKTTLSRGIVSDADSIYLNSLKKWVNAVETVGGINSTKGFGLIEDGTGRYEYISFATASVNATTKETTLTDTRRGLSVTASGYTEGTGMAWDAGASFKVVDYPGGLWKQIAMKDTANTFTPAQTFADNIIMSGTTSSLQPPQLTTTQRNALASPRGIIENTTTGTMQQYLGGAWVDIGDTGTPIATETAEGKVEIALPAEHTSGSADKLVVAAKNTRKTSSGAADENMVPVLDATGRLASGFAPVDSLRLDYSDITFITAAAGVTSSVAVGASTVNNANGTVHTVAHTNDGNYLAVGFLVADGTDRVTSVAYGGQAMTLVDSYVNTPTGQCVYFYVLHSAPSGANNLVITLTGAYTTYWRVQSYVGMGTASAYNVKNKGTATGALSVSVTSTTPRAWLIGFFINSAANLTAGTDTTIRTASNGYSIADSNSTKSPAGDYSLAITNASGTSVGIVASVVDGTASSMQTADFDASADEYVDFSFVLPRGYAGGTVTAKFFWAADSGSGDVVWAAQAVSFADGDTSGAAFGTVQTVTDTLQAGKICVATTPAITIAGTPTAGEVAVLHVYRDADAVADTLATDAKLIAVEITF